VEAALDYISKIEADMGATDILTPLSFAINTLSKQQKDTRIFLLTDGEVDNR
jgi:hypothetical protein